MVLLVGMVAFVFQQWFYPDVFGRNILTGIEGNQRGYTNGRIPDDGDLRMYGKGNRTVKRFLHNKK